MKLTFSGKISNGKLAMHDPAGFKKTISHIDEMDVVVTVEKRKRKRSLSQNSYYFSVVVPMVRSALVDLGHEVNLTETHDFLKARYNKIDLVNEQTGEIMSIPRSTSSLTTVEFAQYIDRVILFASSVLGIVIPPPSTQTELF